MQLKSIFTNSFGILLSRITGLGRDVLMASALGASIWSDMFFVAFKLPNLFRRIFAEGAFTQAFMPSFIASKQKGVFAVAIFLRFLFFLFVASVLVTLFPEVITKLIAWGWSGDKITQTAPLTAINFWYLDLVFIVTFIATLLQYKEHFATTAISTALLNLSMIGALLLYMHDNPATVAYALSIAVVVGGILQVIAHLVALQKFKLNRLLLGGWKYRHKRDIKEEKSEFNRLFIPGVWGNSTAQINSFIDTMLATFLISGSVSFLFYANRVFQLPYALIALATSIALFPSVSKAVKRGDDSGALANLTKAFWLLLFLLGLATLGGMLLAEPIVWLLFERGEFSQSDTHSTSAVLIMYMLGLIPFGLAKLFSLYLYAKHLHTKAAKIATISLAINIAASLLLIKPLGAMGLALAGSIGGWALFLLTVKEIGFNKLKTMLRSRYLSYWLVSMPVIALLFFYANGWLIGLIR